MSYEILILPVPPGAEIEEAGEALEVRLAGGHVVVDASRAAAARRRALAAAIGAADATLVVVDAPEAVGIRLSDGRGLNADIAEQHVVFRVSYSHADEDAEGLFERLFRLVGAAVRETGWRVYDPQGAFGVEIDDDGRDATLEIYLSVVDQLIPGSHRTRG